MDREPPTIESTMSVGTLWVQTADPWSSSSRLLWICFPLPRPQEEKPEICFFPDSHSSPRALILSFLVLSSNLKRERNKGRSHSMEKGSSKFRRHLQFFVFGGFRRLWLKMYVGSESSMSALWQPRGVGGRLKREETYVYLWLIHVDVWQKPKQYCNYSSIKNK